jgi:pimeloyl-ACP methyl ester carboxylesterase
MRALLLLLVLMPGLARAGECVVLLHGLARTDASMADLAEALKDAGYEVANIDYASRDHPVAELADRAVGRGLERCADAGDPRPHFVTHSLGGILVRSWFHRHDQARPERVVMLAPPNRGSHVVDELEEMPGFDFWNGPAGDQLGTDADSVPLRLPPVDFPTGIIAGTQSINLILSNFLPNPDDGKVALSHARVEGMKACIALPVTHTFMMLDDEVIRQSLYFLREGRFDRQDGIPPTCGRVLDETAGQEESW